IALGVEMADIAGMQPAVDQGPRGLLRRAPIALHDVVAGDQDLAILGDPDLDPVDRRPDRVDLDAVGRVAADDRRRLALAIALQEPHPERDEEPADLRIEGRAARDDRLQASPEPRPNLVAHQLVEYRVEEPLGERQGLAGKSVPADRDGALDPLAS